MKLPVNVYQFLGMIGCFTHPDDHTHTSMWEDYLPIGFISHDSALVEFYVCPVNEYMDLKEELHENKIPHHEQRWQSVLSLDKMIFLVISVCVEINI